MRVDERTRPEGRVLVIENRLQRDSPGLLIDGVIDERQFPFGELPRIVGRGRNISKQECLAYYTDKPDWCDADEFK